MLRKSSEIDCGHYIGEKLPFLVYNFETGAATDIVATRATKCPKVCWLVVLDVLGRQVACLKLSSTRVLKVAN